jgi:hypothetical protein
VYSLVGAPAPAAAALRRGNRGVRDRRHRRVNWFTVGAISTITLYMNQSIKTRY